MTSSSQQGKETQGIVFSFDQIDWDEYESHRPPYPDLMWDLIFQHHEQHAGGTFDTALDAGGGGGVVTKKLLDQFNHVIFSDPTPVYVEQAKSRFQKATVEGRISFVQRKFDAFSPETDFTNGQLVDLIAAGTCVHFADPTKVMDQFFHPLLRSGGTVSAFTYGMRPVVANDEPIKPILGTILDRSFNYIQRHTMDRSIFTFFESRYDNVSFDPAYWSNVKRITSLPQESSIGSWASRGISQVREDVEEVVQLKDDAISAEVDYDYLVKYLYNLYPGVDVLSPLEDELRELKTLLGGRRVRVMWPLVLVLATKR